MKNLQKGAENSFLGPFQIGSDENIEQLVSDIIARTKANNPTGIYTALITRIENVFTAWQEGRANTDVGTQKGATNDVVEAINLSKQTSRELYVEVQSKFGLKSSKILEFFPKGLTEVNVAKRGDFKQIITRLKKKTNDNVTQLTQAWVDKIEALETKWKGVKDTQSIEKANVSTGASTRDANVPPLAKAVNSLYLTVQLNNEDDPAAAVRIYFDESPLRRNVNPDNDGEGRLILLAVDKDGNPIPGANVEYTNESSGERYKGKTNKSGIYRSASQDVGLSVGTITLSDGSKSIPFSLQVLDDSDPTNTILIE